MGTRELAPRLHLARERHVEVAEFKATVLGCTALICGTAIILLSEDSVSISLPKESVDPTDTILRLRLGEPAENEFNGDNPLPGLDLPGKK